MKNLSETALHKGYKVSPAQQPTKLSDFYEEV